MKRNRPSLVAIFFIGAFFVGFVIVVLFNWFWSGSVKSSYKKYSSIIEKDYIDNAKEQIKMDVLRTIQSIEFRRIAGRYKLNNIVETSLDNTILVANDIYKRIKNIYSEEETKAVLTQIFQERKFYFDKGFYLLVNRRGEVIGKSKIRLSSATKSRFVDFFSDSKEGFFKGKTSNNRKFSSYVEFFEPLKCYVMAMMLFDELDENIKQEFIFSIARKNTIVNKNRCIFINTKDGDSVVTDNKIFNNGMKLWDIYKNPSDKQRVKNIFKEELAAYNKPGGGFISYRWYEPKTGRVEQKISYVCGYKPWGWIIGEGFYIDQISSTISYAKKQLYSVLDRTLKQSYLFFFFITVIMLMIVYVVYTTSKRQIEHIVGKFEEYFKQRRKINKNRCKVDEFCRLIDYINKILDTFSLYENEFLEAFSYAMEARDTYTKGHSHRVARYAKIIAKSLKLDDSKQEELYKAGLLHDIGKIGVPDNILLKPGKLTPNEYKIVKYHSIFSYEIVQRISQFKSMANYVRHHHERCDGSGYPDGLRCEEIELEAKILAIADVFDALTSKRTYRDRLTPKEAIEILKKEQLDQSIVKKTEKALVEGYISETEADSEVKLQLTKEIDEIRKELFNIDYMTGLKRRKIFIEDVEKLIKKGKPFALFMVDIKNLSFINYEFSTKGGDRLIIYTAVALSEILNELGYDNNNLSRAYNDAFLFTIPISDTDKLANLVELTEKIRNALRKKVKSMITENDKGQFLNEMNESMEHFVDFHVLYCLYPFEADDAEKMIYICVSKKTLSLIRINNIDNGAKK